MTAANERRPTHPLRPFMPADAIGLRELFAASIEELTQDDYDEDQRAAWASLAEDAQAAPVSEAVLQDVPDHVPLGVHGPGRPGESQVTMGEWGEAVRFGEGPEALPGTDLRCGIADARELVCRRLDDGQLAERVPRSRVVRHARYGAAGAAP